MLTACAEPVSITNDHLKGAVDFHVMADLVNDPGNSISS